MTTITTSSSRISFDCTQRTAYTPIRIARAVYSAVKIRTILNNLYYNQSMFNPDRAEYLAVIDKLLEIESITPGYTINSSTFPVVEKRNYLSHLLEQKLIERPNILRHKISAFTFKITNVDELVKFRARLNNNNEKISETESHTDDSLKNTSVKKPKKKRSLDFEFPEPVQWEKVTIKIKEGSEDMDIEYDKKHIATRSADYLGFNTKQKDVFHPNRQWQLLVIISLLYLTKIETATPTNLAASLTKYKGDGKPVDVDNLYHIKQNLSSSLQEIFDTDDEPFYTKPYYHPKFILLPIPSMRNEDIWVTNNKGYSETYLGDDLSDR